MIAYSIVGQSNPSDLRLGFSVWARNPPKDYLSVYPRAAQEVLKSTGASSFSLVALVDDIWPCVMLSRSNIEQRHVSDIYTTKLLQFGFHEVYLVSDFVAETPLWEYLSYATKVTTSEFWKLLPKSKKNLQLDELSLAEAIGFLWHIHVLGVAIDKFNLTGLLAGIRSEFFYLTARKLLPPHDVFFLNTS